MWKMRKGQNPKSDLETVKLCTIWISNQNALNPGKFRSNRKSTHFQERSQEILGVSEKSEFVLFEREKSVVLSEMGNICTCKFKTF